MGKGQGPVFNFAPRGKLCPRCEIDPQGGWTKEGMFPLGIKFHPWVPISPLGAIITPRGKIHPQGQTHNVKNWPLFLKGAGQKLWALVSGIHLVANFWQGVNFSRR
jgi:hypothetical protein